MGGDDLGTVLRRLDKGAIIEVDVPQQHATLEVLETDVESSEPAIFEDPYLILARGETQLYRIRVTAGVVGSVAHIERNVSHSSQSPIWKSFGKIDDIRIKEHGTG